MQKSIRRTLEMTSLIAGIAGTMVAASTPMAKANVMPICERNAAHAVQSAFPEVLSLPHNECEPRSSGRSQPEVTVCTLHSQEYGDFVVIQKLDCSEVIVTYKEASKI